MKGVKLEGIDKNLLKTKKRKRVSEEEEGENDYKDLENNSKIIKIDEDDEDLIEFL